MTRYEKQRGKSPKILRAGGLQKMKKFLLATVSIAALTSATRAADMPAKAPMYPVADWTGVYLGIQGGAVRRDSLASLGFLDLS
jgi:opacity protein-like surface antigen